MRKEPARSLLWLLEYIHPTPDTQKTHQSRQQHIQCERPMAHSVGFNIPAAKCDCTAKQTMQHTKTHTREKKKRKMLLLLLAAFYIYVPQWCFCVCEI
jgi:hypothetical protein